MVSCWVFGGRSVAPSLNHAWDVKDKIDHFADAQVCKTESCGLKTVCFCREAQLEEDFITAFAGAIGEIGDDTTSNRILPY